MFEHITATCDHDRVNRTVTRSVLAVVTLGAVLVATPSSASAEIENNCAVRSMAAVELAGPTRGLDTTTIDPLGRIVVSSVEFEEQPGRFRTTVARYLADGSIDAAFGAGGAVDLGLTVGIAPSVAVGPDGTIWSTGFLDDERGNIVVFEIAADGLSVISHQFDFPGRFVAGAGALDASGSVLLSIVLRGDSLDPGELFVIDVETRDVVRQVNGLAGYDARFVSATGVSVLDGNEVVAHDPGQTTVAIDGGEGEVEVNTAHRTSDAVFYGGSITEPAGELSLFETTSPIVGRYRVDGVAEAGELAGFVKIPDGTKVVDSSPDGLVVMEFEPVFAVLPPAGTFSDIWIGAVDPVTGAYERLAHAAERNFDQNRPADLVEMTSGEAWIVAPRTSSSVFLAQLWESAPAPPSPGALRDQVARLYQAYFERSPDAEGQKYWEDQRIDGRSLSSVSEAFAQSPEFIDNYGTLDDAAFVELVYQNVLERSPDSAGVQFWLDQLATGTTRGSLMIGFSESDEFVVTTASVAPSSNAESQIARLYRAYFERDPDSDGFCFWAGQHDALGLSGVSQAFAASAEFVDTYGALDDDAFVDLVYQNVLGREAEPAGRAFWIVQLGLGLERGRLMIDFSESPEFIRRTATPPNS